MKDRKEKKVSSPDAPAFEAFSAKFRKAAEEKGITLDGLLKDLKKIRQSRF